MKKKIAKLIFSVFLSVTLIFGVIPETLVVAAGQNTQVQEIVTSDEVTVSAGDSMALSEENADEADAAEIPVVAEESIITGSIDGFEWSYNEGTKTLTITGKGSSNGHGTFAGICSDVESMIFQDCTLEGSLAYFCGNISSLISVDFINVDTSNVTDMNGMFYGCSSLTSVDLSGLDTSNVTDIC